MVRFKTFAVNFALVVFACVAALGALEAVLAITKLNTPETSRFIPGKGVTYIPHVYYRYTKEGFSEGRFNSHGFRDYERTLEKARGTFRILVLGDSYTEALQVQLEESFAAILEKTLNAHPSTSRFEVLSLGQSGFGTADEYLRYLNFGVDYNPDLVALAFLTGNDFRNNSKFLNRENTGFYYALDQNHNLVLDRSLIDAYENSLTFSKRLFQTLKAHSHLLNLISERVYLFNHQLVETRMTEAYAGESNEEGKRKSFDLFSDLNIYKPDLAPPWKEAVEITEEIILNFKRSAEVHGSRFLLLSLSNAEQVHPEVGRKVKNQYNVQLDFDQPDRILEEFADKHRVLFLKLMPAFRTHHLKTGQYLHGFGSSHGGHWNQAGHRLAAEKVSQFLHDQHLIPLEWKQS
jgi:hypothetical protein